MLFDWHGGTRPGLDLGFRSLVELASISTGWLMEG